MLCRERELREEVFLLEHEIDFVGDLQRVLDYVRTVGEARDHLLGTLEVESVVVVHAVRVVAIFPESDAEQDVMCVVITRHEEVRVVREHHGQVELRAELEDLLIQSSLPRRVMCLNLEVVPTVEEVCVPLSGFFCAGPVVHLEMSSDFSGHARRRNDDPFVVLCEDLAIDARFVIEALRVSQRGELDQVLVALHVAGEKNQVVVGAISLA